MRIEQSKWTAVKGWEVLSPENLGETAQLVLLFGSPAALQSADWVDRLHQRYPNACLMGCSTAGEISGTQVIDDSLVVTAIYFEQTQIKPSCVALGADETSFAVGDRLGQALEVKDLVHVFVLTDGLQVNGSELVRGLGQHLPTGVTITGGMAGDGDRFQETLVVWQGVAAPGRVVAVGFYGDRLQVGYGSVGGWLPFGPERVITKSEGNVLYELDHQSALALYKKYLGDHAAGLPATALLFPLGLRTPVDQNRLVRTILSVNEADQSLTFAGDVPEGSTVQLMQANFDRLVEGAIEAAEISHSSLQDRSPELGILISCVGRKLLLKQRIEEEVEGVQSILGDSTVLTGFYSYGEIAPFTAEVPCELHNQSMTITTLSEI
jgi:hypothetical protein